METRTSPTTGPATAWRHLSCRGGHAFRNLGPSQVGGRPVTFGPWVSPAASWSLAS